MNYFFITNITMYNEQYKTHTHENLAYDLRSLITDFVFELYFSVCTGKWKIEKRQQNIAQTILFHFTLFRGFCVLFILFVLFISIPLPLIPYDHATNT